MFWWSTTLCDDKTSTLVYQHDWHLHPFMPRLSDTSIVTKKTIYSYDIFEYF